MRSKEEYSQWMEEEAGVEEGVEELGEGGGEAEAWLGRDKAGPEASEDTRRSTSIYFYFPYLTIVVLTVSTKSAHSHLTQPCEDRQN